MMPHALMACSTMSTNSPHDQLCTHKSCSISKYTVVWGPRWYHVFDFSHHTEAQVPILQLKCKRCPTNVKNETHSFLTFQITRKRKYRFLLFKTRVWARPRIPRIPAKWSTNCGSQPTNNAPGVRMTEVLTNSLKLKLDQKGSGGFASY